MLRTARLLNDTIRDTHVPHLAGVEFEGEAVSPPTQIPWSVASFTELTYSAYRDNTQVS